MQNTLHRTITVSMSPDGEVVTYSYFSISQNKLLTGQLTCDLQCAVPTTIVFALDDASINSGWFFLGTIPKRAQDGSLLPPLGFTTSNPNLVLCVFAPHNTDGHRHAFDIYYGNTRGGSPISHDPEETNVPG